MGKQILWELRKSFCRRSFLILFAIAALLTTWLTLQSAQSDAENMPSWGYGKEYMDLVQQYEGRTSEEFDEIRAEQEALRAAHPEAYDCEAPGLSDQEYQERVERSFAYDSFLFFLEPPNPYISPYPFFTRTYLKENSEEIDAAFCTHPDAYGVRALQKVEEWLAAEPVRTVIPPLGNQSYVTVGLLQSTDNGIVVPLFTAFLILLLAAPIYTQEAKSDMDALLLTSRRGKRQALCAKSIAVLLSCVTLSAVLQLLQLLCYSFFFSIPWEVSFASLNDFSSYLEGAYVGLSLGQVYLIYFGLRLLGSAALGLAVMFLSSRCKNPLLPIGAGALLYLYPFLFHAVSSRPWETLAEAVEQAGKGLPELLNWLQAASIAGSQAGGFLNVWFGYYVNFFGCPIPAFLPAVLFSLLVILFALFTPGFYRRRHLGRSHKRKEASAC